MGLYDVFYDEDSECLKCQTKLKGDWQTNRLESLLERWKKGDFLQYRKVIQNPDWKPEDRLFGMLKKLDDPVKNKPLIDNEKVPVHKNCENCDAWLEAYAKILDGRFVGIVEVEADGDPKELVVIKPETTANMVREEFHRRLSHLQESCNHEKTQWMDFEWAPGHFAGQVRVCLRCVETLESKKGWETAQAPRKPKKSRDQVGVRKDSRKSQQLKNHPDRLKRLLKTTVKLR